MQDTIKEARIDAKKSESGSVFQGIISSIEKLRHMKIEFKSKSGSLCTKKPYIRIIEYAIGIILIVLGVVFGFVPFVPGFVFVIAGLALLGIHIKLKHKKVKD